MTEDNPDRDLEQEKRLAEKVKSPLLSGDEMMSEMMQMLRDAKQTFAMDRKKPPSPFKNPFFIKDIVYTSAIWIIAISLLLIAARLYLH